MHLIAMTHSPVFWRQSLAADRTCSIPCHRLRLRCFFYWIFFNNLNAITVDTTSSFSKWNPCLFCFCRYYLPAMWVIVSGTRRLAPVFGFWRHKTGECVIITISNAWCTNKPPGTWCCFRRWWRLQIRSLGNGRQQRSTLQSCRCQWIVVATVGVADVALQPPSASVTVPALCGQTLWSVTVPALCGQTLWSVRICPWIRAVLFDPWFQHFGGDKHSAKHAWFAGERHSYVGQRRHRHEPVQLNHTGQRASSDTNHRHYY